MTQVYSYLRFSLKRQSKGTSYMRQKELTDAYVGMHGYTLNPMTLRDMGVRAFRGENFEVGVLGKFVMLCESGQIPKGSKLVVENLDRLSRNKVWDALVPLQKILRSDVAIVALPDEEKGIEEFTEYNNKTMTEAKIIQLINDLSRGHRESALKSKRVSRAWTWKRSIWQGEAELGKDQFGNDVKPPKRQARPSWLTTDKDGFTWKVIERNADTVRDIFQWVIDGLGSGKIVDKLNEEKRPCFNRCGKWHVGYINQICRNRSVTGHYQPCKRHDETGKYLPTGEADKDFYPLIVSHTIFNKVQKILGTRRAKSVGRSSKVVNLFKGLMHELWGKKLFVEQRRNREAVIQRVGAKFYRDAAPQSFPYFSFEKAVLSVIRELERVDVNVNDNGKSNELAILNERIAEIETSLTDCQTRYKRKASKTILDLIDDLETELEANRASKLALESKLEKVSLKPVQSTASLVLSGKATDEDRHKLRGQLLGLLQRVDVEFQNESSWKRKVIVDLHLCNDRIRTIEILHTRQSINGSKKPASVTWKVLANHMTGGKPVKHPRTGETIYEVEFSAAIEIMTGGRVLRA